MSVAPTNIVISERIEQNNSNKALTAGYLNKNDKKVGVEQFQLLHGKYSHHVWHAI